MHLYQLAAIYYGHIGKHVVLDRDWVLNNCRAELIKQVQR